MRLRQEQYAVSEIKVIDVVQIGMHRRAAHRRNVREQQHDKRARIVGGNRNNENENSNKSDILHTKYISILTRQRRGFTVAKEQLTQLFASSLLMRIAMSKKPSDV